MKLSCGGVVGALPENVTTLSHLPGLFILQVNEIKNLSCGSEHRYREVAAGRGKRRLKLTMTDGVQHISGLEATPIKDLNVLDPAGLKVIIHNATIVRGVLVLKPEVLTVLGGVVEDLEAARKKFVEEEVSRGQSPRKWVAPPDTPSGWKENKVGGSANDAIPFRSSVQDLYLDIAATGPPATNTFRRSRQQTQPGDVITKKVKTTNPTGLPEDEITNMASNVECNTTSRVGAGFTEISPADV